MVVGYIHIDTKPSRHDYVESMLKRLDGIKDVYRIENPLPDLIVVTDDLPNSTVVRDVVLEKICSIEGGMDAQINMTTEFYENGKIIRFD
ncbi:MAG: hypothetical protein PHC66_03315 [Candidatus Nanoarchaeia archaeon]|nr:hypothetical protein [Candidatus Nanoarchaeia archaeon]